ncbi:MAG TPA: hypothetical protein DHW42_11710 [Candidatus Marinimicrobia bacterium]|nr:hypothetical protein [Candidatus Neomarinimicrobiota bacterium]
MKQKTFTMSRYELPEKFRPVINLALQKIFGNGISGFTIEKLAAELRISKKTIYKYFRSKEEFVEAVLMYNFELMDSAISSIPDDPDDPLGTALSILKKIFEMTSKMSSRGIYESKIYYPQYWQRIELFRENVIQRMYVLFKKAQKQGVLRQDINIEFSINILMKTVQEVFQPEYLIHSPYPISRVISMFIDMVMNGLLEKRHEIDFQKYFENRSLEG